MSSTVLPVATPTGTGRLYVDMAPDPRATLVLGHGAGGGVNAVDLDLLARRLPSMGVTVLRFEQPWRTAGRKVAVPPARLDEGWRGAVDWLLAEGLVVSPLYFGGRSAGARVACRTAPHYAVAGVVCLSFPLHLPGRPEKSRASELLTPDVPRLVVQGTNDTFGTPTEIRQAIGSARQISLVELPGADHSFRVAKAAEFTPADVRARVVASVGDFLGITGAEPR
jgi:predicted alpha/beta-hydrolase family hydrolase